MTKIYRNSEYRVLSVIDPFEKAPEYLICEAVYNSQGEPSFFDTGSLEEGTPEELKSALEEMLAAFEKPILKIRNFECECEDDYEQPPCMVVTRNAEMS